MWNRIPDTEPVSTLTTEAVEYDPADLLPLSHLSLDLDAPIGGWDAALAARGVQVHADDLGRRCILRADARVLFTERAESEAWQREAAARQAAEHAQQWGAQLRTGVPADQIPEGMSAAEFLMASDPDRDKGRRRSVLEEALDNDPALTYHPVRDEDES